MESFESQISQGMGRPVHGSIKPAELRRLGLDPAQVIDFEAFSSLLVEVHARTVDCWYTFLHGLWRSRRRALIQFAGCA